MWIFANKGFFSIVASPEPGKLLVRARIKGDIENAFPGHEVLANAGTDYEYRATVPKAEVQKVLTDAIQGIDYTNFKNSCEPERARRYSKVWAAMAAACNGRLGT